MGLRGGWSQPSGGRGKWQKAKSQHKSHVGSEEVNHILSLRLSFQSHKAAQIAGSQGEEV